MATWTREKIIREILRREAADLPLSLGKHPDSVETKLYSAASRIFGSWGNAVQAAGIAPERARVHDPWPASKVLSKIRGLARRSHPMQPGELKRRHAQLVQAARRCFGTWSKAVVAAGVDPNKLKGILPWTKPRIIEAILLRALNGEPLGSQTVKPGSLSKAAIREFGSWPAALRAAGLDPEVHSPRAQDPTVDAVGDAQEPAESGERQQDCAAESAAILETGRTPAIRRHYRRWGTDEVLQAIRDRATENKRMNATAVADDDGSLYRVAMRRYGGWDAALQAAGLDPEDHRVRNTACSRSKPAGETQQVRPGDDSEP
jgi:hypothetical protein